MANEQPDNFNEPREIEPVTVTSIIHKAKANPVVTVLILAAVAAAIYFFIRKKPTQ